MRGPRVHFVNRYFAPDHSATSQVLSGIAFSLARGGYDVHVCTSRQLYENPGASLAPRDEIEGVAVSRVASSRFGRSSVPGRACDYITFYLSVLLRLLVEVRRGDIIVAKTDPPLLSIVLWPVAFLKGAQLVNWMQDIFPEVAAHSKIGGGLGRLIFRALVPVRNWSIRLAQRSVAIGEGMRARLRDLGVADDRIRVISNWADGQVIKASDQGAVARRVEWGWDGKMVVAYSGNFGRVHAAETILEAMERISRRRNADGLPDILFAFIGGGAQRAYLKAECARRGLTNVEFRPYEPQERLSVLLSSADVHLVTLRPEYEGLVVPSKVYGILAAARPVLFVGARDGEVARLVDRFGCGVAVAAGDGGRLADAILGLAADRGLRETLGGAARRAFDASYTLQIATLKWHSLLSELTVLSGAASVPAFGSGGDRVAGLTTPLPPVREAARALEAPSEKIGG